MTETRQGNEAAWEQHNRRQERIKRAQASRAHKSIRVLPKNEEIRRNIKHGVTGARFPKVGSVEWPLDQFTKRRIRDGDVTIEPPQREAPPQQEAAPQTGPRFGHHRATASKED